MHDLFYELYAFDPKWRDHYATLQAAAKAAGVYSLWLDYCRSNPELLTCKPGSVPDVLGATQRLREQQATASLPYNLETIGEVPDDSDE